MNKGLVQIYYGHGKGKTTAAWGQAMRMAGHRLSCLVVQFLKGGLYSGELWAAERLAPYLEVIQAGRGCPYAGPIKAGIWECTGCGSCFQEAPEDRDLTRLGWQVAERALVGGSYKLVVLDEIGHAIRKGYLAEETVLAVLAQRREAVEVVLTGREFSPGILAAADLITEMRSVKHHFAQGEKARLGIEY